MAELRGSYGEESHHVLTRWFGTPDLHRIEVYSDKPGGYSALTSGRPDFTSARKRTSRRRS